MHNEIICNGTIVAQRHRKLKDIVAPQDQKPVLEAYQEITKRFVHKLIANLALFGGYVYARMDLPLTVSAIKDENSLMARCDRRCYDLHRPGKAEERDQVGNEAMEALVFAASI